DRLAVVISLAKTDAQPSPQVDRRDHSHGRSPKRQKSFNKHSMYPWAKGIARTECFPGAHGNEASLQLFLPAIHSRNHALIQPLAEPTLHLRGVLQISKNEWLI